MRVSEDSSILQYPFAGYKYDPPIQTALSRHFTQDFAVNGSSKLYVRLEHDEHLQKDFIKRKWSIFLHGSRIVIDLSYRAFSENYIER